MYVNFFMFNSSSTISADSVKLLCCKKLCPVNSVKKFSELTFRVLLQKQRHGECHRKLVQKNKKYVI